jgi:hypothetical protein
MGMAAVETHDGEAKRPKLAPQPGRRSAALDAKSLQAGRVLGETAGEQSGIGRHHPLEHGLAGVVDDADRRFLQ